MVVGILSSDSNTNPTFQLKETYYGLYKKNTGLLPWFTLLEKETTGLLTRQDVTLLKANLLEIRAKLLLKGGHFDSGEELCGACVSIWTVMLSYNHAQTLAAQETLAKKAK
jgi:hypothetical protein